MDDSYYYQFEYKNIISSLLSLTGRDLRRKHDIYRKFEFVALNCLNKIEDLVRNNWMLQLWSLNPLQMWAFLKGNVVKRKWEWCFLKGVRKSTALGFFFLCCFLEILRHFERCWWISGVPPSSYRNGFLWLCIRWQTHSC